MSLVRFASPDHPTRYIDLGPAIGRRSVSRLGIRGGGPPIVVSGSLVTGIPSKSGAQSTAEYKAREAEKARERRVRCGKLLPYIGEPCGRTTGHKYDCKSAEAIERMAAGRRSDVGRWP